MYKDMNYYVEMQNKANNLVRWFFRDKYKTTNKLNDLYLNTNSWLELYVYDIRDDRVVIHERKKGSLEVSEKTIQNRKYQAAARAKKGI
jgi:hypothetical protein